MSRKTPIVQFENYDILKTVPEVGVLYLSKILTHFQLSVPKVPKYNTICLIRITNADEIVIEMVIVCELYV